MRRDLMLTAAVLVAMAVVPAPAQARVIDFDSDALLLQSGRLLQVKGPISCTRTERMAIRVTVTQRAIGAVGEGSWRGLCRARRKTWTAREVSIQGRVAFRAGPARACALGVGRRGGRVVEAHQWCETIRLAAPASAR